eukprot:gene9846-20482_t
MSSRRERLPSGRSNIVSTAREEQRDNSLTSGRINNDGPQTLSPHLNTSRKSKPIMVSPIKRDLPSMTASSQGQMDSYSSGSTILRERKDKQLAMKEAQYTRDKEMLGPYNAFSKPIPSTTHPLRSAFLDPEVNNISPSKSRTQLISRVRAACVPHPSYDVDGDGWVSQEDYRTAKKYDLDCDGILDLDERKITKEVIIEEFLNENNKGLRALGALGGRWKTIEDTLRSSELQRDLSLPQIVNALHQAKFALRMSTRELMCPADYDAAGTRTQRYFTDKMDCTAWNDYDTVPRFTSSYGLEDHGGSRRRLLFSRKQKATEGCQVKLETALSSKPRLDTRRHCLITNPSVENF